MLGLDNKDRKWVMLFRWS